MIAETNSEPKVNSDTENKTVIQIRNLSKSFGENHVLRDFNMDLNKGENIVVLGKSGSGKSVLIKCIIGLIKPETGTIKVLGQNIPDLNREDLDKIRVKVGFLFQSNALYDSMTVRENLEFPLRRHSVQKSNEKENDLIMEALTNVGLAHTIDLMPSELSGGMKKRIALARTLILKPEIILYDEPTTGLDPITGKEISNLMNELAKKYNTSSIVISHDLNCVKRVASKIAMLIDGKCYAQGSYEELEKSTDPKIKHFFEL
ncbi:MAG: ABC transporter ATP-binding protein [Bacteroidota bacterium]|nr:ABC transporter ATP-binding protein [Bacteroidota bacterium]MDP3145859.1 ABC transporter ATP-binding protein [Bacteroidota bacterium]MDP3558493.1 ABC transporter ATP-binding protein [Bacteroidota bacterium]